MVKSSKTDNEIDLVNEDNKVIKKLVLKYNIKTTPKICRPLLTKAIADTKKEFEEKLTSQQKEFNEISLKKQKEFDAEIVNQKTVFNEKIAHQQKVIDELLFQVKGFKNK
ncbi:hypothetical protein SCLARK_001128 [Spiroplasma clarkii]|uniref:hypothetical protein n=1 Tax=Spiroplasma clarkii TaxID=2139 RepID=UPI000B574FAF|nr:hypothetical protein [Spiroplasma clarkii]ARU91691.1 hypothetical protein SCLARK_001128 [Spiroplasma clarkii]